MKKLLMLLCCLVLLSSGLPARAEARLTVQQVFETVGVPLALANDDGAIVQESYSAEELGQLLQALRDNGHDVDERLAWLCAIGEGYWEEETLMAICRKAFGGVIDRWTPEEQYWFGEMAVAIRFAPENSWAAPGSGMSGKEALARAAEILNAEYGQGGDLRLTDTGLYRSGAECQLDEEEGADGPVWQISFEPKREGGTAYTLAMTADGERISSGCESRSLPEGYTISEAIGMLSRLWFRAYMNQRDWPQEAWVRFAELLKDADTSETLYHPEYKAFLMAGYPAEDSAAFSREEAVRVAANALDIALPFLQGAVLTSAGRPVWKVTLEDENHRTHMAEIDAADGTVVWTAPCMGYEAWAGWVPHECYTAAMGGTLEGPAAVHRAAEAVRALTGAAGMPLEDEDCFDVLALHQSSRGAWHIRFNSRRMEWGSGEINIEDTTGEVLSWELDGMADPVNGDNILTRFRSAHGWWGDWDQSVWVDMRRAAEAFTPETDQGKLIVLSEYLPESEAYITREEAIRIATEADSPSGRANEANSCVLLGDKGYPVWKLRMLYGDTPGTTLYEIDGMTGRVLDVQKFVADNTDVNPTAMIFTLHKVYARYQLDTYGEEGAIWLAQDAVTKAFGDLDDDDPGIVLSPDRYALTVTHAEGWTVEAVDRSGGAVWRVRLSEDGLPLSVEAV